MDFSKQSLRRFLCGPVPAGATADGSPGKATQLHSCSPCWGHRRPGASPHRHVQCPVADRVCLHRGQVGPGGPLPRAAWPRPAGRSPVPAGLCRCLRCPPHIFPEGFIFTSGFPQQSGLGLRGVLPGRPLQPVAELSLDVLTGRALHGAVCRAECSQPRGPSCPIPSSGLSRLHQLQDTCESSCLTATCQAPSHSHTVLAGRLSRVVLSPKTLSSPCPAGSPLP